MSRRVSRLIGAADGRVQWSGVAVVFLLGRNRWTGGDVQCGGDLRLLIDFVVSVDNLLNYINPLGAINHIAIYMFYQPSRSS